MFIKKADVTVRARYFAGQSCAFMLMAGIALFYMLDAKRMPIQRVMPLVIMVPVLPQFTDFCGNYSVHRNVEQCLDILQRTQVNANSDTNEHSQLVREVAQFRSKTYYDYRGELLDVLDSSQNDKQ